MPTRDVDESFWDDYDRLSPVQQRRFLSVLRRFVHDADNGTFRAALRVKPMVDHPGIWEMTWDGNDGRATFRYGREQVSGKRHIIWRRIGGHEIFREP